MKSHIVKKYRFKVLLLFLLLMIIVPSFTKDGLFDDILVLTSMMMIFIQSLVAVVNKDKYRIPAYIIALIMISIMLFDFLDPDKASTYIKLITFTLFFGGIIVMLIRYILDSHVVNSNIIIVSVVVYLIMGLVFASFSAMIDLSIPYAYTFSEKGPQLFQEHMYYSYVTMTTLGYGDIYPLVPQSKVMAYMTAITGQLYLAIIVALLVGNYMSSNPRKD